MQRNSNLIFDIGTSEGNDTAFYLAKGFDVVALEADPETFAAVSKRFEAEIADGRLKFINAAAFGKSGETLSFFRNDAAQGISSMFENKKVQFLETQTKFDVVTIDYKDLCAISGVPYYCKIDIEGAETYFLSGISKDDVLPDYVSVEAHTFAPIEQMIALGYKRFKYVDQRQHHKTTAPEPALEGKYLGHYKFDHASGYFGRETAGSRWMNAQEATEVYEKIKYLKSMRGIINSWYDCHCALYAKDRPRSAPATA